MNIKTEDVDDLLETIVSSGLSVEQIKEAITTYSDLLKLKDESNDPITFDDFGRKKHGEGMN